MEASRVMFKINSCSRIVNKNKYEREGYRAEGCPSAEVPVRPPSESSDPESAADSRNPLSATGASGAAKTSFLNVAFTETA